MSIGKERDKTKRLMTFMNLCVYIYIYNYIIYIYNYIIYIYICVCVRLIDSVYYIILLYVIYRYV